MVSFLKGEYMKVNASNNVRLSVMSVLYDDVEVLVSVLLAKIPMNNTVMTSKIITAIENIFIYIYLLLYNNPFNNQNSSYK